MSFLFSGFVNTSVHTLANHHPASGQEKQCHTILLCLIVKVTGDTCTSWPNLNVLFNAHHF